MTKTAKILVVTLTLLCISGFYSFGRTAWVPMMQQIKASRTVDDVVSQFGNNARARLSKHFAAAQASYPPSKITLLAVKESATLELWVGPDSNPTYIRDYPIRALSGNNGPKLKEGDRQVPEGLYSIIGLNPNSSFHLSMKLNYPNAFDLKHAKNEGREFPGTNIFIHGMASSIGCLAMGNEAIEELFVMAADTGRQNITVAISPKDPRMSPLVPIDNLPWTAELYQTLTNTFGQFKRP